GDGVEHQRAFARAGDAGEYRQAALGDLDVDVFQVVFAGAMHPNEIVRLGHSSRIRWFELGPSAPGSGEESRGWESAAGLDDPDHVSRRIAERAVTTVRLVHRLLYHLRASRLDAIEGLLEVRSGEVQPTQQPLGEQIADDLSVRLGDAWISGGRLEHD